MIAIEAIERNEVAAVKGGHIVITAQFRPFLLCSRIQAFRLPMIFIS